MNDLQSMRDLIVLLIQRSERSQDSVINVLQQKNFVEWIDHSRLWHDWLWPLFIDLDLLWRLFDFFLRHQACLLWWLLVELDKSGEFHITARHSLQALLCARFDKILVLLFEHCLFWRA